jgi:3-phytase/alkaline phosphatase D
MRSITLAALASIPATMSAAQPQIAAGDARGSTVVLWAKSAVPGTVSFQIAFDEGFTLLAGTADVAVADPAVPAKWQARSLDSGTRYYYRATDASGVSRTGTVRTPAGLNQGFRGFRMGVSGDWRGELSPFPGIRNAGASLDAFFALGDTIYADYPSPAVPAAQCETLDEFRLKNNEVYSERFGLNTLGDLRSQTSVYAMIDDHEVTNDFQGGAPIGSDPRFAGQTGPLINNSEWYTRGIQAFTEYNPIENLTLPAIGDARTDERPDLYRSRTFGRDAGVFMIDARSFRDVGLPAANPLDQNSVIQFLLASFNPARTMLSTRQVQTMLTDLASAQLSGVTWKFVLVPEPIQNLGVLNASDRFEGYAAERSFILDYIRTNGIRNVVFVAADIHGTLVNNLTYQTVPFGPQIDSGAFEITTGALAFDAPFGPTVAEIAFNLGLPGALPLAVYNNLPLAQREAYIQGLINAQIGPLGYTPIGLQDSAIRATLLEGGYSATNTYGWTDFDIDPATQDLTITTWGIQPYTEAQLLADPAGIAARVPAVMSRFRVSPRFCSTDFNRDGFVDFADYIEFVECYESGTCDPARNDFNGDGFVDFFDYDGFVAALETGDC